MTRCLDRFVYGSMQQLDEVKNRGADQKARNLYKECLLATPASPQPTACAHVVADQSDVRPMLRFGYYKKGRVNVGT